jgi:hypothetical protein
VATTLVVLGRAVELHLNPSHTLKEVHDSKPVIVVAPRKVSGMRDVGKALEFFPRAEVYISGPQWIEPKNVVDVREHQFLALLLM